MEAPAAPGKVAAPEDNTYQSLPFTQDWTNSSLITANDDWSGVPGITGFLGDGLTATTGVDPQTVVADNTTVDVIANQANPDTLTSGGVAEFEITNPVIALQGSGTADAPFVRFYINTTGWQDITIAYKLRDIDGSADDAVQPVALQYRIGETGDFINLPAGYVADASTGPSQATLVTPVTVTLPAGANNQPQVQIRIITANAVGSDEWIGIDDISITGASLGGPSLSISKSAAPISDVEPGDLVTYTIALANSGTVSDTNVYFTDTLPAEVSFAYWVDQPSGAVGTSEITWNGTVTNSTTLTFTFAVTNNIATGAVDNTAEFSGTNQAGSDSASYQTGFGLPYFEGFGVCPAAGWTIYSVASDRNWLCGSGYMSANGYGGDVASDDWLISPAFDLDQTGKEMLSFDTWTRYLDSGVPYPQLSVYYSTDYAGSGDPTPATWTPLSGITFSPADSQQWTNSGEIDLAGLSGSSVYFAFQYISSGTGSGTSSSWRVDNVSLYELPPFTIGKSVNPTSVEPGALAVYTIVLVNDSDTADPNMLFTDTLPVEVDLAYWLERPTGTDDTNDEITWSGTLTNNTTLTFTFAVTNNAVSGTVNNTAEFSGTTHTGSDSASFSVLTLDRPNVVSTQPAAGATNAQPYLPLKATFDMTMTAATINTTNFTLEDAASLVAGLVYYDSGTWTAVFEPNAPLAENTIYTATVSAAVVGHNGAPMAADYTWIFTTTTASLSAYHGSLHNHTAYSDGAADPDIAFSYGYTRGLDFMAITDHSHSIDDAEWEDTLTQAINHTIDGAYVALRGAEYSQTSEGHLNVYNTVRHPVRTERGYAYADYTPLLADFYDWMVQHPEAEGMFNHPAWMNFNDWAYRADVEPAMQLVEVGNGAYSYYVWTEEEYRKALDYGWKVAPTNNGDTHNEEWGIDNPGRTGLWASELTYAGVLEAMDAMRVFATEDGNFELYLQADGYWMGETISNDNTLSFTIYVYDPDGEIPVSLELYSAHGQVVTFTTPSSNPYTWTFDLPVSNGIHYFFARAEQADGDRTVTAPIWTEGNVDVKPIDLQITPAQLSTLAPANFEARIANQGIAAATNITVNFKVGANIVGSQLITVPAMGEAYASTAWAPDTTGLVDISVEITGVPAGDNPDDNTITVQRNIVDYPVPLIIIDNGHTNNVFTSGDGADFEGDLVSHGYNWIEDTDGITTTDLASAVLLIISDPGDCSGTCDDLYSEAEEQVIADYVNDGGALLVAGDSNYNDHGNSAEINSILTKITGSRIRMNTDGTYDDTNQGGVGPWNVLWHVFPATSTLGIGINTDIVVGFSGCSIYGIDGVGTPIPLTTGDGVTLTVVGDDDTYQNTPQNYVYPAGTTIPMAAVQQLPGGGRIAVWGDSSESFSNSYTYVPGDGYQNEIYNMQTLYWLTGRPWAKQAIAQVRIDANQDNTPDNIDRLAWIEGTVTAEYGNFYDVLYVQDDTGGITVYAPVTSLTDTLTLGTQVRVVGRVESYQGDTEVQIDWDPEQVQIIGAGSVPDPLLLSTYAAGLEANEGWLIRTIGEVVTKTNNYIFFVDDGSGPVRVFIDGYNGNFASIAEGDWAQVIGLASEDGDGHRIRVRGPGDVTVTLPSSLNITKTVQTPHTPVHLGDTVTYTIIVANSGGSDATGVVVTDTLPEGVTGNDLDWTGIVTQGQQVSFTLTGIVTTSTAYYDHTITNTAYVNHASGSDSDYVDFIVESALPIPNLSTSTKMANTNQKVMPGDLITYTITLSNTGNVDASTLVTDVLGPYYIVYDTMDFTESSTGTLTWNGLVTAGESINLYFAVQVVSLAKLPIGTTVLENSVLVDDGVHTPFAVSDMTPPRLEIMGIYLPLIMRGG